MTSNSFQRYKSATATVLFSILVTSAFAISPLLHPNGAYAATTATWDGGGDGKNWSDPANWSGDTLPNGSEFIVIQSFTPVFLDTDFTLDSSGTLDIHSGTPLQINDTITLTNEGTINIDGNLALVVGSTLNNNGVINNAGISDRGTINNDGLINASSGIFVAGPSGILNNNNSGTIIVFNPTVGPSELFTSVLMNSGNIVVHAGSDVHNPILGTIDNSGTMTFECNATFVNQGTFTGNPIVIELCPDTIAPAISITGPLNGTNLKSSQFAVTGTSADSPDNTGVQTLSGVQNVTVQIDGGSPHIAIPKSPGDWSTWSITTAALSDARHTISSTATDGAGNKATVSIAITIDTNPPDTKLISAKDGKGNTLPKSGTTHSSKITFTFSGTDNLGGTGVSGFQCSIDSTNSFSSCTSPQAYFGLKAGIHTFYVRSLDNAGNFDPTPATFTWKINGPVV